VSSPAAGFQGNPNWGKRPKRTKGRKRGKGDWDKPSGLAADVLPSTPWELGVQGKYSQLPSNVPCTGSVSQSIAMTQGGVVVNQNSLLPDRLLTGEWVCKQHCTWSLLLCCTTVAAILGKRWTGCHCLLAGILASLTTLQHRYFMQFLTCMYSYL
jgi:hypothetical protein